MAIIQETHCNTGWKDLYETEKTYLQKHKLNHIRTMNEYQKQSIRIPVQMRGGGRTGLPRSQEQQQRLKFIPS